MQRFDLRKNLSEQQQARVRRTANSTAGMQLILLGVMIAITFLGLKVMFFTTPTRFELVVMTAISGLCLALGIVAIYRNR